MRVLAVKKHLARGLRDGARSCRIEDMLAVLRKVLAHGVLLVPALLGTAYSLKPCGASWLTEALLNDLVQVCGRAQLRATFPPGALLCCARRARPRLLAPPAHLQRHHARKAIRLNGRWYSGAHRLLSAIFRPPVADGWSSEATSLVGVTDSTLSLVLPESYTRAHYNTSSA
jgi:hypothetical protein